MGILGHLERLDSATNRTEEGGIKSRNDLAIREVWTGQCKLTLNWGGKGIKGRKRIVHPCKSWRW